MPVERKALIIGGGIAGMSAAIALIQSGLSVDLCEQDPHWKVYGAGITITGPTLRAMGRLGVLDEVLRQGYAADGIDICSVEGRKISTIDTRSTALGSTPSAGGILRPTLHNIVSARLLALQPKMKLGATVETLHNEPDHVKVVFSTGETARYDLVVGADGIYSQTRRQIFPDAPGPHYAGQYCWRLMMPRHPEITRRTFFLGGSAKVGLNPVSPDGMYMFYLEPQAAPLRRDEDTQHHVLRDLLASYGGILKDVRDSINASSQIICRPLETVFVGEDWTRGRTVLIGDAAHATTPQLASGAGMGIEDGIVLGEEIGRSDDVATGLKAFMARRYPRCKLVIDSSLEIGRLEREQAPPSAQTAVVERALETLNEDF